MRRFAQLYAELDESNKTNDKVMALVRYFSDAPARDSVWGLHFLVGRRIKRLIKSSLLREWAADLAQVPDWLFDECYQSVGDLAETISLLVPGTGDGQDLPLHEVVEKHLLSLRNLDTEQQQASIKQLWTKFDERGLFVLLKLLTGGFRVGVSQKLVTRSLSQVTGIDPAVIAHRLMGNWEPTEQYFQQLTSTDASDTHASQPFPFFLAHPLDGPPDEKLGAVTEWQAEWKWDGIRAQLIRRNNECFLWSRGEELITPRFPEITAASESLDDGTALDGELLAWKEDTPLPFGEMQRRIGRKTVGKKLLSEVPVLFMAFDLFEFAGQDIRSKSLDERRRTLEQIFETRESHAHLRISPPIVASTWEELALHRDACRDHHAEGLMLKRLDSAYGVGRTRGDWWKWKIEPYTVDGVLIYAQRGHGRRASLYTDYTFAVWDQDQLVPFAKAYTGLTDAEIRRVDQFVRKNTLEKFGPVRSVTPQLVFELAFENIQHSKRHKSGIAVRFPRIVRWREDKTPQDADHLATIKAMIHV